MEITRGVHLLQSTNGSYVYLIMGEEPILIDTSLPGRAAAILTELETLGLKPTDLAHIFLTHHDVDHMGNAKALQQASGAKLWAPQEDLPYILGQRNREGFKRLIQTFVKVEVPQIDATYAPGQRIGGIEVIPTPGHTPGHVSFLSGDTLFCGDLVMSKKGKLQPASAFLTWDKAILKRSLSEVKHFSFTWVCTAHGEPVQRGNLWEALTERL
ncbi:MBL fold metallo-hydrolase [Ktedonospora formicarum]|uniref:Hydrolase n=1 Tax=Ktedonospora formicarum TaxID=2778364 RepID=A0A8J3ID46_9CHLR|nr:MBL fold metallo-hydrolase [Ktedonospora formicarum]GHO50557.1 hydrolase [Ktedonospora formicarum]